MATSLIKIPKDLKHKITIPEEIWHVEDLQFGDYIEITIKKVKVEKKDLGNNQDNDR